MTQPARPTSTDRKKIRELNQVISKYQKPSEARSYWQLANTIVPYGLLWAAMAWTITISFWLTLPLLILSAGFLIRTFIIFHDCGHGSFFRSNRANDIVGYITGIITFTPYHYWRNSHAKHHATSANLDKRGYGDVWMMTVDEYKNASRFERLKYRLYRNPLVMFMLGPLFLILVTHRRVRRDSNRAEKLSVHGTNLGIAVLAALMCWAIGWKAYLVIQFFVLYIGIMAGIWLFYVQHQFEGVYWARQGQWNFTDASLEGGSYYKLPRVLHWFTGSIGYHHVHHLNSRIPNYNLSKVHEEIPILAESPTIGFFGSFKSLRFRLWDEKTERLISFGEMKKLGYADDLN